jgi:hypothetical protein
MEDSWEALLETTPEHRFRFQTKSQAAVRESAISHFLPAARHDSGKPG